MIDNVVDDDDDEDEDVIGVATVDPAKMLKLDPFSCFVVPTRTYKKVVERSPSGRVVVKRKGTRRRRNPVSKQEEAQVASEPILRKKHRQNELKRKRKAGCKCRAGTRCRCKARFVPHPYGWKPPKKAGGKRKKDDDNAADIDLEDESDSEQEDDVAGAARQGEDDDALEDFMADSSDSSSDDADKQDKLLIEAVLRFDTIYLHHEYLLRQNGNKKLRKLCAKAKSSQFLCEKDLDTETLRAFVNKVEVFELEIAAYLNRHPSARPSPVEAQPLPADLEGTTIVQEGWNPDEPQDTSARFIATLIDTVTTLAQLVEHYAVVVARQAGRSYRGEHLVSPIVPLCRPFMDIHDLNRFSAENMECFEHRAIKICDMVHKQLESAFNEAADEEEVSVQEVEQPATKKRKEAETDDHLLEGGNDNEEEEESVSPPVPQEPAVPVTAEPKGKEEEEEPAPSVPVESSGESVVLSLFLSVSHSSLCRS